MHFPRQEPCGSVPSSRSFDEGDPRTKSRFGTPQRPVPPPVAYGSGRRDALQFSLQSSSTAISASSSSSSPRLQKPLGGGPKPKTARLAVGNSQDCLHLPDGHSPGEKFGRLQRAAIGPSIARQDHVLDDRIDLGLPALAGEHAVVAYAGLHVVALKIGSQLAA
jgi:hypothetical protein